MNQASLPFSSSIEPARRVSRTGSRPPKLPTLLDRKIYKTGQTRGADDDEIYQNRVGRNSTVLIPHAFWEQCRPGLNQTGVYENGFIVLIRPADYFNLENADAHLATQGLCLGNNALVFYETRTDWERFSAARMNWRAATNRIAPLGGQYVVRISATTATEGGAKIVEGFSSTSKKGAGIRVYEYASTAAINDCRKQLEALYWLCYDSIDVAIHNGLDRNGAEERMNWILAESENSGLLDQAGLVQARILNAAGQTICPLCLDPLSAQGFFSKMAQADGREVLDLTITQINLFHISELRTGALNHRPYNLGWGHHHCNVVVKDAGILETLNWMNSVIERNRAGGWAAPLQ
jgi:hypothetical protein